MLRHCLGRERPSQAVYATGWLVLGLVVAACPSRALADDGPAASGTASAGDATETETAPAESPAGGATVDPRRVRSLERALAHVALAPDPVEALAVGRGLTTALLELTCGIGLLLPDAGQRLSLTDGLLGAGCLAASIGLFVSNGIALADLRNRSAAHARLARFRALRAAGRLDADDLDRFEASLFADEAATRRSRGVGVGVGIASFLATGIVGGVTAAGRIDQRVGVAVSAGAFVVGGLGLSLVLVESPAERAATVHRRLGLARDHAGRGGLRWSLTPVWSPHGVGITLTARGLD